MKNWLQRAVTTAGLAGAMALAASGTADAAPHGEPGGGVGNVENTIGMSADLVGSKRLGSGPVGGLRGDVTRPAEELPMLRQLPVITQLGSAVPLGSTPLGVDQQKRR